MAFDSNSCSVAVLAVLEVFVEAQPAGKMKPTRAVAKMARFRGMLGNEFRSEGNIGMLVGTEPKNEDRKTVRLPAMPSMQVSPHTTLGSDHDRTLDDSRE